MLVGIGTALVALGAFMALTVALASPPPAEQVGARESDRQERNATVTKNFAALSGFAGAVLLTTAAWPWAFVAVACVGTLYWLCLAISTRAVARQWLGIIELERNADKNADGEPGRVSVYTAAAFHLAPDIDYPGGGPHFYGAPGDPGALRVAEHITGVATRQSR